MIYLYDLDGTLIYSKEFILGIYRMAYDNSRLEIRSFNKDLDYLKSHTINQYLEYLNVDINNRVDYANILSISKNLLFERFKHKLRPNTTLCQHLRGNIENSYIVTNASITTSQSYLKFLRLVIKSDRIYSRERLIEPKPSKNAYYTVINSQNINIEDIVVFEDSEEGYISAKGSGISNIKKVNYDSKADKWSISTWE